MTQLLKRSCLWSWYLCVSVVISLAILMSLAGFLTPLISRYQPQLETLASQSLHHPVHIQHVKGSWYLLNPVLRLSQVAIMSDDGQRQLLDLDSVSIHVDLLQSLWQQKLVPAKLLLSGAAIQVNQTQTGYDIVGLKQLNRARSNDNSKASLKGLLRWIAHCEKLQLDDIQVQLHPKTGQQVIFDDVHLDVRNHQNKHRLAGHFKLAQTQMTKLSFHGEFEGDSNHVLDWQGELQLKAKKVVLAQWLNAQLTQQWQVAKGLGDIKLYAQIKKNHHVHAQGELSVQSFRLKKRSDLNLASLSGEFNVVHSPKQTQIQFNAVKLVENNQTWPGNAFALTFHHGKAQQFEARIARLPLSLLNAYLPDNVRKLDGLATQSLMQYRQADDWTLEGTLRDVALEGNGDTPSLNHLNGVFHMTPTQGRFDFSAKQSQVSLPRVWAKPIVWRAMSAVLTWSLHDDSYHIRLDKAVMSNADLSLHFELSDDFTLKNPLGYLNLLAGFEIHSTKNVKNYFNKTHTDPEFYHWITHALTQNQGAALGTVILRGDLHRFPFKHNEGVLLADMKVHDLDLAFNPKWPHLRKTQGDIIFENNTLRSTIYSGELSGIALKNIDLQIPDMGHLKKVLHVDGELATSLPKAIALIKKTPIHKHLSELDTMKLRGNMGLVFKLKIPLRKGVANHFSGHITTQKAEAVLTQWPVQLKKIQGRFDFDEHGFKAEAVNAQLLGETVRLAFGTEKDKARGVETVIKVKGKVDSHQIATASPYLKKLKGMIEYAAKIDMPHEKSKPMHVYLSVPLKQVSSLMPAGLINQKNSVAEQFTLATDIYPNDTVWLRLQMGTVANAIIRLKDKSQVEKGEVVLGSQRAMMPKLQGILIRGKLESFNLADLITPPSSTKSAFTFINKIRMIDLTLKNMTAWSQTMKYLHLVALPTKQAWHFQLSGDKIKGKVTLTQLPNRLLSVNLEKLMLSKDDSKKPSALLPKDLPKMNIDIKQFHYGKLNFGHLSLLGLATGNDYEIRDLQISRPNLTLSARVLWRQIKNKKTETDLVGEAVSKNLETLLNSFGYPEFITASRSYFNVSFRWPGAPQAISLEKVLGTLNINLQNGAVTHLSKSAEQKIGLGKLLGLLSLRNLPRRLVLDFKDLGTRGLPFQTWRNDMVLKDGIIHLNRSELDGPVASAQLLGRVNLNHKTVNIKVTLHPYLTSSLPLIATIAGGPLAGAATWIASKVVGSELRNVAKYRYSVTGAWDKPIIKAMSHSQNKTA